MPQWLQRSPSPSSSMKRCRLRLIISLHVLDASPPRRRGYFVIDRKHVLVKSSRGRPPPPPPTALVALRALPGIGHTGLAGAPGRTQAGADGGAHGFGVAGRWDPLAIAALAVERAVHARFPRLPLPLVRGLLPRAATPTRKLGSLMPTPATDALLMVFSALEDAEQQEVAERIATIRAINAVSEESASAPFIRSMRPAKRSGRTGRWATP